MVQVILRYFLSTALVVILLGECGYLCNFGNISVKLFSIGTVVKMSFNYIFLVLDMEVILLDRAEKFVQFWQQA